MRGVPIGKMRHRIEIRTPVENEDTTTGTTSNSFPTVVAKRWASIEQLTGDEEFTAQQVVAGATHKITIRYCKQLTEQCQLKFGKKVFAIKSVWIPEEVKDFQVIFASRR